MNSVLESLCAWIDLFVEAFNNLACNVADFIYTSFTENPNDSDSNSDIAENTPVTSNKILPNIPQILQDAASLFEADDFQILLLKIFVTILIGNICLIYIAWHIYGERISDRFMNSNISPEELKKQVSELNLPTEHSQRYA